MHVRNRQDVVELTLDIPLRRLGDIEIDCVRPHAHHRFSHRVDNFLGDELLYLGFAQFLLDIGHVLAENGELAFGSTLDDGFEVVGSNIPIIFRFTLHAVPLLADIGAESVFRIRYPPKAPKGRIERVDLIAVQLVEVEEFFDRRQVSLVVMSSGVGFPINFRSFLESTVSCLLMAYLLLISCCLMEDNLTYYFKLVNNFMAFFFKTFMHTNFFAIFLVL